MSRPSGVAGALLSGPATEPAGAEGGELHHRVRREVLSRILSGAAPPGRRVSVSRLAAETGMSRTPVREALLGLEREGFLTLEENRGFFVRELTEREARELYPILHALEDLALVSAGRPSRKHVEQLRHLNERLAAAADAEGALAVNVRWHRLLTEPCGNQELLLLIDRYRMRVHRYELTYYAPGPERLRYSVELHDRIADALEAGRLTEARRVLEEHWVGDYSLYLPGS